MAEAILRRRRTEIEGGPEVAEDCRPKFYASDGTVRSLYMTSVITPLPEPIAALADAVIAKANAADLHSAIVLGVRLASAVRRQARPAAP
jgi:hypothetical protein